MCACGCAHICLDIQAAFEQPLHQRLVVLHRQCQLASGQQPPQWSYGQPDPCGRISDKKHTWPLSDSQRTRFLWTDRAANSTEEQFLPQTATGGQTHARPSCGRQMSPDKRRVRGRSPLACSFPFRFHTDAIRFLLCSPMTRDAAVPIFAFSVSIQPVTYCTL